MAPLPRARAGAVLALCALGLALAVQINTEAQVTRPSDDVEALGSTTQRARAMLVGSRGSGPAGLGGAARRHRFQGGDGKKGKAEQLAAVSAVNGKSESQLPVCGGCSVLAANVGRPRVHDLTRVRTEGLEHLSEDIRQVTGRGYEPLRVKPSLGVVSPMNVEECYDIFARLSMCPSGIGATGPAAEELRATLECSAKEMEPGSSISALYMLIRQFGGDDRWSASFPARSTNRVDIVFADAVFALLQLARDNPPQWENSKCIAALRAQGTGITLLICARCRARARREQGSHPQRQPEHSPQLPHRRVYTH
jgi:hypothetical protein